jgi:4-O-beta-D-mannosyl-D-glucose phosphorylase
MRASPPFFATNHPARSPNVTFSNGWVARADGSVLLYYASSDTRLHVATSSVERLLDYVKNTPPDGLRSAACVQQRLALIRANRE